MLIIELYVRVIYVTFYRISNNIINSNENKNVFD